MKENFHKQGIKNYQRRRLNKIYCSTGKNKPSEIAFPSKNLLLGLEFNLRLSVISFSNRLKTPINGQKTHYQPSFLTHSLTNLLYWAYWGCILFHLDLGYDLWPYNWRCLWEELVLIRIITVMASSGPHQTSPHHAELTNVHHQQGELHNLEHGNHMDNQQEGSSQTLYAGGSGYR